MSRLKKLRKLRKNPRRFVYDAIRKRRPDLAAHIARRMPDVKPPCRHRFTVVSAVYNVEKYLDDFFRSMDQQTVSMDHLELIMVDDGSTDGSAEIIERWRRIYPRSIRYFKKENGGQASARNLGLEHVTGDWVTFIDSDDFVHHRYFEEVDRFLTQHRHEDLGLACCKWVFFHEARGRYAANHPLNYRFAGGSAVKTMRDGDFMASSTATSFYRADVLREHALRFDEHIRPNFEDGHFSGQYLLRIQGRPVGVIADAHYYYRKREAGTSTLDSSWEDPRRFDVVIERGYIGLLNEAKGRLGYVPPAVQRLVLYDLFWYLKRIVADEASVSFLTEEQKQAFIEKLPRVFEHIDDTTIINFSLAGCRFFHRVGMLGRFKGEPPPYYLVYARQFDRAERLLHLGYFYWGDAPLEEIFVDGEKVVPHGGEVVEHEFLGSEFVHERLLRVRLDEPTSELSLRIAGQEARLRLGEEQQTSLTRGEIEAFHHDKPKPRRTPREASAKPKASTVDHATAMAFFEKRRPTYERIASAVAPYVSHDATIFDVGANIGFFSLVLAEELGFEGTAHLFEPVPHLAALCRETLRDVPFEWELHEYGLSDEDGPLDIFIAADGNLGWNTIVSEKASKGMTAVPIQVRAFDSCGIDVKPSFVKIDVEGAEYRVLRGMRSALEAWSPRPVILCEIGWGQRHPHWTEELEVLRGLESIGYEGCNLEGGAIDVAELEKTTDVLFLPKPT